MSSVQKSAASAQLPFAALLVVASAIRIFLNNVTAYSPADETVYLRYTQMLARGESYARLVRIFIDDRAMWVFPNPLRWGYLGVTTLFCRLAGQCTYGVLATLSTIAGIVAVGLTYWIGLRLFERTTALMATALMATSPLQLAMGRRALTDEVFCAVVLASVAVMIEVARPSPGPSGHPLPRSGRGALVGAWILFTTFAFAVKEQFLLIYPVILLFWWLRERKIRWIWALPPMLYVAVFCVLAGDATKFFQVARLTTSTMNAPYPAQFQSGPPHRLLIDFLAVAPLVTIAFLGAAFAARSPEQRQVLILAAGILVVHSLLSSKNLRYVIAADPFMRLLVASWMPRRKWLLIVNAAVELFLFHTIFVTSNVYDPVTHELLRALRMLPL